MVRLERGQPGGIMDPPRSLVMVRIGLAHALDVDYHPEALVRQNRCILLS